jgi:RRXRR protein
LQQRYRLQERTDATLIRPASSHAEADEMDTIISKPVVPSGRVIFNPGIDQEQCAITESLAVLVSKWPRHLAERSGRKERQRMRIPVVDSRGVPLMPCHPAKARLLCKSGKARPKRNKLGLFYVQLCHSVEPDNQLEGWQTKALREKYGLQKTKSKNKQSFESHAVDAFVLAASVSGACQPTCTRLWYVIPAILHRRQLHRLEAEKGGKRKPYGSTCSLSLKRGTLVRHAKYGLCTVGGFDRQKQTISLNEYRTNKRLTQGAKVEKRRVLTWVAFRAFLVGKTATSEKKKAGKGKKPPIPTSLKGGPVETRRVDAEGFPQADN